MSDPRQLRVVVETPAGEVMVVMRMKGDYMQMYADGPKRAREYVRAAGPNERWDLHHAKFVGRPA